MSTLDTYYTRPMSSPWSKPLDVDRLSEAEADVDFVIPLAELPRLRAQLASVAGEVHGRVHFRRAAGIPVAELTVVDGPVFVVVVVTVNVVFGCVKFVWLSRLKASTRTCVSSSRQS